MDARKREPAPDDLWSLIHDCLPNDHARQVDASYYAEKLLREATRPLRVLDLGCGDGRSVDLFRRYQPSVEWTGVDIEGSPEVNTRTRSDAAFCSYDGEHLPFAGGAFDLVYANQVFEHVRKPEAVLAEVTRVLVPGGSFVGSVSSLEPYHSLSIWCYTPYGWWTLLRDAGLEPRELRPGIDGIALIRRHFMGRPKEAREWFVRSPLNEEIDAWGAETGRRPALINLRKVQYCGHLVFWASRGRA